MLLQFVVTIGGLMATCRAADPARCCSQNQLSATMMSLSASLQNGSTQPNIMDDFMFLDNDYNLQMQRVMGHLLDQNTGIRQNYTIYNDYKHKKIYNAFENGSCAITHMASNEVFAGPCIPDDFTYGGEYHFRGGAVSFPVNVWSGIWQSTLQMSIHVAAADCSPVAVNFYGNTADGSATLLYTYLFADVVEGSLRSADAMTLPDSCKQMDSIIG